MRGARFTVFSAALCLAACSATTPVAEPVSPIPKPATPAPRAEAPKPVAHEFLPEPVLPRTPKPAQVLFPVKSEPIKGGPSAVESPPVVAPDPVIHPLLNLQRERVAKDPGNDEEKMRLAVLHAMDGEFEKADLILSGVRSPDNRFRPYLDLFLRRALGDHQEARKLLATFNSEERVVTGFNIGRAVLCSRVRRYRDYVQAASDHVKPGGYVLLYVEPRNYTLKRNQEKYILHLKYEWELFDDRSKLQKVPAWEKARPADRQDRVTFAGPVVEFYQSFRLPLPKNLSMGHYRVKVTVTDAHSGKNDQIYVPIYVTAVESSQ